MKEEKIKDKEEALFMSTGNKELIL